MYLHAHFDDNLHDDYRRLGVRDSECRLVIIRHAASQRAGQLASNLQRDPRDRQLSAQLSQVATSTYRLLDPRRRENDLERAHVGRIHDAELLEATVGKRRSSTSVPVFGLRPDSGHMGVPRSSVSTEQVTMASVSTEQVIMDADFDRDMLQVKRRSNGRTGTWDRIRKGWRGLVNRVLKSSLFRVS